MSLIVELYASLMASRACHLPFLSFLITFFSISINVNSVNSPASPCASFDCGNGLTLGYPFYRQNGQPTFCGYPNFAISCIYSQPIFQIAHNSYRVKEFNNSDDTLTMTYDDVNDTTTCPIVTHGFTLEPTSFLNYTKDNKIVHFYYNCTVYPPSVPNIKCLQRGAKHSYAFVDGSVPEFNWIQYCESIITVPVIDRAVVNGLVANGSEDVLKKGFKLTWKPVDNACQLCEASGGFCGYSSSSTATAAQNFFCFCNDGHHSQNCHDAGEVSRTSSPNYVAIGAMIFGGLAAISIVVFFINKKKIRVQKGGFSQIPSNYGK
ncbi:hypothetical protein Pfo_025947 [Paulownia fortunei]|nr:hypothetical protein Pfo_025947 [Paulownia fortunei]